MTVHVRMRRWTLPGNFLAAASAFIMGMFIAGCRADTPPPQRPGVRTQGEKPFIVIDQFSFDGMSQALRGSVVNIPTESHYVVAYAFIEQSGWWSINVAARTRSRIAYDGSWTYQINNPDSLAESSQIQIFVLPDSLDPPFLTGARSLPGFLYSASLARTHLLRD
jgi:hypothetical protein